MTVHPLVASGIIPPEAAYLYIFLSQQPPWVGNSKRMASELGIEPKKAQSLYKKLKRSGLVWSERVNGNLYRYRTVPVDEALDLDGQPEPPPTPTPATEWPAVDELPDETPPTPAPPSQPAPLPELDLDPLVYEQMQKDAAQGKGLATHADLEALRAFVGGSTPRHTPPCPTPNPPSAPTHPTPPPEAGPPYQPPAAWQAYWSSLGETPWKLRGKMLDQLKEVESRYSPKDLKEDFKERLEASTPRKRAGFLLRAFFQPESGQMYPPADLPVLPKKPYAGREWLDKLEAQTKDAVPLNEEAIQQGQQTISQNVDDWEWRLFQLLDPVTDLSAGEPGELLRMLQRDHGRGRLRRVLDEIRFLNPNQINPYGWERIQEGSSLDERLHLLTTLFDLTAEQLAVKGEYKCHNPNPTLSS